MMLPTIDAELFHVGFISSDAVNDLNRGKVVSTALPEQPLGEFERWRWVDGQWAATKDYRGHSWYNPEDTDDVFRPTRLDAEPPAGWIYWAPGQNKAPGQAELERKKWVDIRRARDALLAGSDWVTIKSAEQGLPTPSEWVEYRQALRDITLQTDPFNIVWPIRPASGSDAEQVFTVGVM